MKNRALNYAFFSQIGGREDFLTLNTFSLDGHIGLTLGLEFLTKEPTLLESFIDIITFLNIRTRQNYHNYGTGSNRHIWDNDFFHKGKAWNKNFLVL